MSEVRLHPNENAPNFHDIELYSEWAAILASSAPKNDEPRRFTGGVSVLSVAGGHNRRDLPNLKCQV